MNTQQQGQPSEKGSFFLLNRSPTKPGQKPIEKNGTQVIFQDKLCASKQNRTKSFTEIGVSKNSGIPKWMVYNGKPY